MPQIVLPISLNPMKLTAKLVCVLIHIMLTDRNISLKSEPIWVLFILFLFLDRVQNLIDQGAPAEKIVLGIPTYGRSWSIKDPETWTKMRPPVPAKGAAPAGFLTKASGSMSYMEICLKVCLLPNQHPG